MVGEIRQELAYEVHGVRAVGDGEVGDTRCAGGHGRSAEPAVGEVLTGELAHHLGAAHKCVGVVDHDDDVGQA